MIPHPEDTIVALSSAAGPGARGIVRISGPNTRQFVESMLKERVPPAEPRHWQPMELRLSGFASALPADCYFFRGPHSYTGQDLAELHTVSSPPVLERLISDLMNHGARAAQPGEFTLRAFLAGKKNLVKAEAVLSVIEAGTDNDLRKALDQLAGGVTEPLAAMRDDLLNLLADVEAGLDFTEEDIEFVTRPDILLRLAAAIAQVTNVLRQLETRAVSGRPVRVALVGEPNAGKSSLFNALLDRTSAIVSDVPGTTRDFLTHKFLLNNIELELIDTAGWQHAETTIEEQAQRLGRLQAERADIVIWCVPADSILQRDRKPKLPGSEVMLVRTKADLAEVAEGIAVSVRSSVGLDCLREELTGTAQALIRPSLAPSQSRCRHHLESALENLRIAHQHAMFNDPPELLALALRTALDSVGEMTGAIYTNDLLDRIFSRFCIGK
jgi:tRNA modification GTPase